MRDEPSSKLQSSQHISQLHADEINLRNRLLLTVNWISLGMTGGGFRISTAKNPVDEHMQVTSTSVAVPTIFT